MHSKGLYIPMLLMTAGASLLAFGAGELLCGLSGKLPNILISAIFFTIFAMLLCLAVFLCEYIFEGFGTVSFRDKINNKSIQLATIRSIAILFVVIFGFSSLFQFLYELEPKTTPYEVRNYAFIIDNSGSMDGNDSSGERFTALEQIAGTLEPDAPVAIYLFGTDTVCARPFQPQTTAPIVYTSEWQTDGGGTRLYTALCACISDIEKSQASGELVGRTRIIVLTDGFCEQLSGWFSGSKRRSVVKKSSIADSEIFTVGFGDPDISMLTQIAEGTGGTYFDAGDAYNIAGAMNSAISAQSTGRLLMGVRSGKTSGNFGYALMRIIFVTLLGATMSIVSALIIGYGPIERFILIQCSAKSLAAGILIELLTQNFSGDTIHRLLTCLFIGTLVLFLPMTERRSSVLPGDQSYDSHSRVSPSPDTRSIGITAPQEVPGSNSQLDMNIISKERFTK